HYIFHRYEPREPLLHLCLLGIPPVLLSTILRHYFGTPASILVSYLVFLVVLAFSVVVHRISPFHPLARFPGPLSHKISRLSLTSIALSCREHVHIHELHEHYGDVVRIGPNEVSIRDPSVIPGVLGTTGFPRSDCTSYSACSLHPPIQPLLNISGEEHTAKRRWWNRGFTSAALKEYEPIVARHVEKLVDSLSRDEEVIEMSVRFSWLRYSSDNVSYQFSFGAASDMLVKGDQGGIWRIIQNGFTAAHVFTHIPWLSFYISKLVALGLNQNVKLMRQYGVDRARERLERGSLMKDLFYYLNNEDGAEERGRPLSHVINDGALAIVAGGDTTSNVLSSICYFLLNNPTVYKSLQAEVDKYYPPGEAAVETMHHQNMPILNAVINESLRLLPVLPEGTSRVSPPGGRSVGTYYIPEGTKTMIHAYSVNRDPRNFSPRTTTFWPDRWLIASGDMTASEAGIDKREFVHNSSAFIPFSFGPANCVGKNLALQEMRMTICSILQRLQLRFAPGFDPASYEVRLRDYMILKSAPLPMEVRVRDRI
ncbi:hypothetical protein CERSUDRAFT_60323, partial [Gelatoporia subvermispora B]